MHTKGPWNVRSNIEKSGDDYWRYPFWVDASHGLPIADVRGVSDTEANAHLIAAAPDMLEALEGSYKTIQLLLSSAPGIEIGMGLGLEIVGTKEGMTKAIRKAKGE